MLRKNWENYISALSPQISVSAYQRISVSAYQRISVSAYQRISVSAYQRISVSAYQRTKQEPLAERLGIGQQKMSLVENTEVLEVPKIVAIVLATRYKRLIVIQTKKFRVLLKPEFLITPFSID